MDLLFSLFLSAAHSVQPSIMIATRVEIIKKEKKSFLKLFPIPTKLRAIKAKRA